MPPKKNKNRQPARKQKVVLVAQQQKRRPRKQNQRVSLVPSPGISRGAPVSLSSGTTVVTNASRSVTYARREFVQELSTPPSESKTFTGSVATFDLNPGLRNVFPWLSSVSAFEQYRFKRLNFTFQSSMPTSAAGQVVLVTNVDAKDPLMTSAVDLMSYSGACTGRVWDSHTHKVPSQATTKKNYVRAGPVPASADQSLYDVGKFYAFCLGVESGSSLGTLWVDYEIEFFIPKLSIQQSTFTIIKGDNKTTTNSEPFGQDEKLTNAPGSTANWECPPSSVEGYCQININPEGNNFINLTATAKQGELDEKNRLPLDFVYDVSKLEVLNISNLIGNFVKAGFEEGPAAVLNLTAEIVDPREILKFYFKTNTEDLVPSDIVPNLVYSLWSGPSKNFF